MIIGGYHHHKSGEPRCMKQFLGLFPYSLCKGYIHINYASAPVGRNRFWLFTYFWCDLVVFRLPRFVFEANQDFVASFRDAVSHFGANTWHVDDHSILNLFWIRLWNVAPQQPLEIRPVSIFSLISAWFSSLVKGSLCWHIRIHMKLGRII